MLIFILIIYRCCDVSAYFHESKVFNVSDKLAKLFELGKKDYENIQKKGGTNSCWADSIVYMTEGCKNLTEHVQMNMALRYSDCFMTSCGLQSHNCAWQRGAERRLCIKSMSGKGYHAYTEFFISLQSICFFLESESWHNRTRINVNNLVASSALLTEYLKESSKYKSSLLYSQRQTVYLQSKYRRNLSMLKHIFTKYEVAWNDTVEKYVSVALKQEKLVLTVYDLFSILNGWALDRYYWLGTAVFYIVSVASMYAFTVQHKVRRARLRIVLVLTANVILEKILYLCLFQKKLLKEADELFSWIWMTRKIAFVLCVLLIFTYSYDYSYHNPFSLALITSINSRLHALRVSLQKHNKKDVPAAVGVHNIPVHKTRSFSKVQSDRIFNIEHTWTTPSYLKTLTVLPDSSTSPRNWKTQSTFPSDSSVSSVRRYNLRVRNTPPIDATVATAL